MKKMGQFDISVTADIPTYSVLKNSAGEKTYIAYNPFSDSITVHFSDGYSMNVPARELKSVNTSSANINACLLYTSPSPRDRTRLRMPSSA